MLPEEYRPETALPWSDCIQYLFAVLPALLRTFVVFRLFRLVSRYFRNGGADVNETTCGRNESTRISHYKPEVSADVARERTLSVYSYKKRLFFYENKRFKEK